MAVATVPVDIPVVVTPTTGWRRFVVPTAVVAAICVVGAAIGDEVPTWIDAHVRPWVDDVYAWTVRNNSTHWLFTWIFEPISDVLSAAYDAVLWVLRTLRWPGVLALVGIIGWRTGGTRAAVVGVLAMTGCGILGFWDETMITMALMLVAVALALLIGIPIGILAGRHDHVDRGIQGFLDTAQVMPAFVYFLPVVVAFGIRVPAAVVATVIYATAPAVRLTSHGLRSVPVVATEVGNSFGCTSRQLLAKVQLPMARRAMLLGLNQVIMMAFAIVVLASLLGVAGLGAEVNSGLQQVNVGQAFAPGLAIVLAAVALDRITTGERQWRTGKVRRIRLPAFVREHPLGAPAAGVAFVVLVALIAKLAGADQFPEALTIDVTEPINDAVGWVNENFRTGVPVVGGTGSFSDFLVIHVLDPVRDFLLAAPWWSVVAASVAIGWASAGWRLALVCGLCFAGIAALRTWDLAMDTLSQVLVIAAISVVLAVPIGIWAGRSDRVERILRPVLDAAQVMPAFVYLVPVIFLFNVGRVPGIVATVIYALPPCIRLVSLGLREVPIAPREAAVSFGATPRQELFKVQLPMAGRAIMLGINQTIMMVLSMVVIAALIGAGALGLETVYGLTKGEVGRGVAGGVSIVLLAIVLDRITQAWGGRRPGDRDGEIMMTWRKLMAPVALAGLLFAAACGDDDDDAGGDETTASTGAAGDATATTAAEEPTATTAGGETTDGGVPATTGGGEAPAEGEGITLAVNPWTGSAVNSHVAKIVLESELGTPVELVEIDENATWPGMAAGDIDAVLEVWPSGHAQDRATYIDEQASVVDLGPLGATGTIGWYVPSFVVEEHPELASWEGFQDPELAGLFSTAETGDRGQFLLGAASYVSYDEQIIANLELPLQVVVAGSEAAEISAIEQAFADNSPLLLYFWQPHWLHSRYELTEVELPEYTEECAASALAEDGNYDCEYPVDELYKAANAGLEEKNPAAFAFLQNFQLTTEQQNEIAALVDSDGMAPEEAAQQWVDENADVVAGWLG